MTDISMQAQANQEKLDWLGIQGEFEIQIYLAQVEYYRQLAEAEIASYQLSTKLYQKQVEYYRQLAEAEIASHQEAEHNRLLVELKK